MRSIAFPYLESGIVYELRYKRNIHADDIVIVAKSKFEKTLCDINYDGLKITRK